MSYVGERVPKLDAAEKATGRTRYVQDLTVPGMLEGRILRSPVASAKILSIDVERARKLPGVLAVVTAADAPAAPFGYAKDTLALKGTRVRRIGDEVAAVAAVDADTAKAALALIRVEYEPMPANFDLDRALDPSCPRVHEDRTNLVKVHEYAHGDVQRGFASAAIVVEGTFRLPAQAHGCLGTTAVIAEWDHHGRLQLHDPTQIPFLLQRDLATALGITADRVEIRQPSIGGAFGARLDLYPHQVIAALLARQAGKPVRILFDREEDFETDPVRPRTVVRFRTGAAKDGTLIAREADVLVDCGAYVSWGAMTPVVMTHTFGSFYKIPHARFRSQAVYTNTAPTGAFRGFGNPELIFALESQMNEIADGLGIDPIELRLKNANYPGQITEQGSKITSCGMKECLEAVQQRLGPAGPPSAPHLKRGVGVAAVFHVGGGARIYRSDGCGAMVKIDDFGKVVVTVGGTDIGQGMETISAQVAADTLGVPMSRVVVSAASTDVRPWDVGVHASRTTFIAGNAVRLACEDAKRQIEEARVQLGFPPGTSYEKIVRSAHFREQGSMVLGRAFYDPPSVMMSAENKGNVSAAYVFGAHGVEVEVDTETGKVRIVRYIAAHDVGKAINPMGVEGQIEGGVLQGIGYALLEDVVLRDGGMANTNFLDYRMPGPQDMPKVEPVIIETNDPNGPFGAKGIGEPPLVPVAPALASAIAHATGIWLRELPMSPERVWRAVNRVAEPGR